MAATPDRIPWVEKYAPPPSHFHRIHVARAGTVRTASRTSWATTRAWRDCALSRRMVRMRLPRFFCVLGVGVGGGSIRIATHSPIATIFTDFTIFSNICHLILHPHLYHHHHHHPTLSVGNMPHLILTGPPGTGKTSSINALAAEVTHWRSLCFITLWLICFAAVGRDEQRSSANLFLELLPCFRTV
jgi:hypothetical protein